MDFHSKIVVFCLLSFNSFAYSAESPRIVIVGAGLSGISAAVKLIENNYTNVLILEAENRIGGRILSIPFANGMIDLGAQWIHGESNNAIYDLAGKHFKFGDTNFDNTPQTFQLSNGTQPNQKHCQILKGVADDVLASYPDMAKYNGTLGEFFLAKFNKSMLGLRYYKFEPELPNQMIHYYQREVNVWNGSESWFNISARLNTISGNNKGSQFQTWRDKGFQTVFDYLTKKLPNPSEAIDLTKKTLLGIKVVNIKFDPFRQERVTVSSRNSPSFIADHVIFTGSLGVLKQSYKTLFTPKLPARKIRAIQTSGFGNIGKIFLEFEAPFWPKDEDDWVSYDLLWQDVDRKNISKTDRKWLLRIRSFTRVDSMPNVIEALLAGYEMEDFEQYTDEKVAADCLWLLKKFLRKPLTKLKNIRKTRWLTNENFYGTYSYQSMSAAREKILPIDLAEPLTNEFHEPMVLFAGEATDEFFASNAHGAVNSGRRAAQEIIDFYDLLNNDEYSM